MKDYLCLKHYSLFLITDDIKLVTENKIFSDIQIQRIKAFKEFHKDVSLGKFPGKKNSVSVDKKQLNLFKKFLNKENKN